MDRSTKRVGVAACSDYARETVSSALRRAMDSIGIDRLALEAGAKVFLKPNMLLGTPPERCISTHPSVVRATAELLLEQGCEVTIGDSPGGGVPFNERSLMRAYTAAGYADIAEELGITLCCDTRTRVVAFPEGRVARQFPLMNAVIESDALVVVSKLKAHMWMTMTGAVKNLFGAIPGLEKPAFHYRFQTQDAFAGMLIDLNGLLKPAFQVMDAVYGMEGDGPTSGSPRRIGAVLVSGDPFALDLVASRLVALEPMEVPVLRKAIEWGILEPDFSDVIAEGDPIEALVVRDFEKPSSAGGGAKGRAQLALMRLFGSAYAARPVVVGGRCMGCGRCSMNCPAHAIEVRFGKARIDPSRCICCYCCHEMCLEGAIVLKRGIAGALLERFLG